MPRVSVIMPVFDGEQFLSKAIQSILNQTFGDFEFIIIDDASRDSSLAIARKFARRDARIQIIENPRNLGISATLNKGIRAAQGDYLARIDADDVSAPKRLEYQVDFMNANTAVGICGSWVKYIGDFDAVLKFPKNHDSIHARMLFENALAHPSVMMRSASIRERVLYYDEDVRYAQDYELWSRAVSRVMMANVDQVLVLHRAHSQRVSSRYGQIQQATHDMVHRRLLTELGLQFSDDDIRLHQQLSTHRYDEDVDFLKRTQRWLKAIAESNGISGVIPEDILAAELCEVWARVCQQTPLHPIKLLLYLLLNPMSFRGDAGLKIAIARILSLVKR